MHELKAQPIWFCWNYETRKGKRTKVPISAYGTPTGTNAPYAHTWVTYDEAAKAATERGYNGVGFRIPEDCFFLDIDHRDAGDPYVEQMLARFDSYAERSVSGNGIHIYGKCDVGRLPAHERDGKLKLDSAYYQKNPTNGTELYIGALTNRFAVYTGDVIRDQPVKDCNNALLVTLDKNMRRSGNATSTRYSPKRDGDTPEDREAFDIVASLVKQKNSDKFCRLYQDGDIAGYGSASEAECALCAMIAFRAGNDPEMIDRIFRSSALYREKWEREDYRTATIAKGIEACHGTFHRSKMDHPEFIRFNEQTGEPYVVVPLLARHVREHLRYILVRDSGKQALLKYVYEDGCYRLYSNDMLMGVIKQFIADYDEELVKMSKVTECFQHITTDLNYIAQDDLDADETVINFANGLLHVSEDELTLTEHTPNVYSTIQIPCEWTGKMEPTPVFDEYLRTLTNNDTATKRLLLEFIGACISNIKGWRMKKALFLVGEGDTGKSQLKSLVEMLLGKDNYIGIDLKEIEARFGTGSIYGTRLAGSSDMSFVSVDELKTFKKITGGDSLFAEFKGMPGFAYTYNGLLWFCMNRLPKFGGDNGQWVYDRIMVVRCPNVISKDKQDKKLLDKMYAERNGIVYKAIRALQNVIRNGYRFTEPASVNAARDQYMKENNTVINFFNECMCEWPDKKINPHCTTGRIYHVYQAWCRDSNNGYAKTAKEFREELAVFLDTTYAEMTTRQKGNTYYRNYTITSETKNLFAREYGYDGTEYFL